MNHFTHSQAKAPRTSKWEHITLGCIRIWTSSHRANADWQTIKGPQSPGKRRAQSSHSENRFNTATDEIKEQDRAGTWYVTHSPLLKSWRYFNSFSFKWWFRWVWNWLKYYLFQVGLVRWVFLVLFRTAIATSEMFIKMPSTGSARNCLKGGHLKSLPSYTTSLCMSLTENGKNWFCFIKMSSHSHQPTGAFQKWKLPIGTCLPVII